MAARIETVDTSIPPTEVTYETLDGVRYQGAHSPPPEAAGIQAGHHVYADQGFIEN